MKPEADAITIQFYGLLDSPSLSGAYRFELTPGKPTVLQVTAHIFARKDIAKLGVAPLSSMYLFGPNRIPLFDDFRSQVHDSDGLLMHTGKQEWIWKPLSNGPGVQLTSLFDTYPKGFGLVQRDRDFSNYLDLEANYHRRPSKWVSVEEGDWGSGKVELLSFPTKSEFNDNIAVYWVPDKPFNAGDHRYYSYSLRTFDDRLEHQTLAQVERTRVGWDALPGENDPPSRNQRRFLVDFNFLEASRGIEPHLKSSSGKISDLRVQQLPNDGGWRALFRFNPDGDESADFSLYLTMDGRRISETWTHTWYPEREQ
jgi:glucans biosynthesis protein